MFCRSSVYRLAKIKVPLLRIYVKDKATASTEYAVSQPSFTYEAKIRTSGSGIMLFPCHRSTDLQLAIRLILLTFH
jgi:hypothetical protein